MKRPAWDLEVPVAITVCDPKGVILEMNDLSAANLKKYGGRALVGKSLYDCHPGPAGRKLARLMRSRRTNIYTVEKRGVKKIIIQAPWFRGGKFGGYVELGAVLPGKVPHFVRRG